MAKEKNKLFSEVEGKLYNYNNMKVKLNSYRVDLEYLKSSYEGCKGKAYTSTTSKTNNFYSSVENELVRKEEKIQDLKFKIIQLDIQIKKIDNALLMLSDEELSLVKFRYFSNRSIAPSWVDISERLGYSEKTCRNMRDRIIDKIKALI